MKKRLFFVLLLLSIVQLGIFATRPVKTVFTVKQPDGTLLKVQRHGNSQYLFYTTSDNKVVIRGEKGAFFYALIDNTELVASSVVAHNPEERQEQERLYVSHLAVKEHDAHSHLQKLSKPMVPSHKSNILSNDGLGIYGTAYNDGVIKSIGKPLIPVIMVDFDDRAFMPETTADKLTRMLNEQGYSDEEYCKGSVKDYFTSQSDGLFIPTFEVIGKVRASKGYAYYGSNSSSSRIDTNCKLLIQEVLDSVYAKGTDFSKFAEGNEIPLVCIYYAGPGEHSSYENNCEDFIWAHFSDNVQFKVGDIKIKSYFVGNETLQEYAYDENSNIVPIDANFDGIGIFVHEFGHALGLPDFYYTGSSSSVADLIQSPDYWSVMDYGQYMYDGYAPIGYSAYERSLMGWIKLYEPQEPGYISISPFDKATNNPKAVLLRNDENPAEYYILENRQPSTWFPSLMGNGMLVTHIDYVTSKWQYNTVNNDPNRQGYQIVPADNNKSPYNDEGKFSFECFKGDLFPGTYNMTELTDDTSPSTNVYAGNKLGKPIYDIKEEEGIITFCYKDPSLVGINFVNTNTNEQNEQGVYYDMKGQVIKTLENVSPGIYFIKKNSKVLKVLR